LGQAYDYWQDQPGILRRATGTRPADGCEIGVDSRIAACTTLLGREALELSLCPVYPNSPQPPRKWSDAQGFGIRKAAVRYQAH